MKLKVAQIGNSCGVVLPKELLSKLNVEKGDDLFVVESPIGITLSPLDPEVEEQITLGRQFMKEYRETFKALAE